MAWRNIFEHFLGGVDHPTSICWFVTWPFESFASKVPRWAQIWTFSWVSWQKWFLGPFVCSCHLQCGWVLMPQSFFCWMSWGFLKLLEDVLRRFLGLATHVHCAKFWGHWFETGFEGTRHGDALFSKCQGFNLHVLPDCSRASPRMLSMHE